MFRDPFATLLRSHYHVLVASLKQNNPIFGHYLNNLN